MKAIKMIVRKCSKCAWEFSTKIQATATNPICKKCFAQAWAEGSTRAATRPLNWMDDPKEIK